MTALWTDQVVGPGVTLSDVLPAAPAGQVTTIALTFTQVGPLIGHGKDTCDLDFVDGGVVTAQWGSLVRSSVKTGTLLQLSTSIGFLGSSAQRAGRLRLTTSAGWPSMRVSATFSTAPPVLETPPAPVSRHRVQPLPICWPSGFTIDA